MATETTHDRAQLQRDITTVRACYANSGGSFLLEFARVLAAAQCYCDTLPKVQHVKKWAVLDRVGLLRGIFEDSAPAERFASYNNFVVCELNGSCEF